MSAAALLCLVIAISDGDTLTSRCGTDNFKIRIAEIDAPEKAQPFGNRSKQSLAALCFQQQARVTPQKKDRYGRTVGRVSCQGIDASAHQVSTGMAWLYRQYLTDESLIPLETQARKEKRGLWADDQPVPPWEWRRQSKR